jgi:acyl-CoA synthetase (AMP-forming)/AMP-acid ligase II
MIMKPELVRDLIRQSGANKPKKTAFVCGSNSVTWGAIDERSSKLVSVFKSLGIEHGQAVGILAPESIEVYEHFFACFKLGAIRTGINRRFSSREILHILTDASIKMILVHADCLPLLDEIKKEIEEDSILLMGYGGDHKLALDYDSLLDRAETPSELEDHTPESPVMYTYTSGTTGNAKGVILSDRALRTVIQNAPSNFGFSPDDIFYCPLANSWAAVITNLLGLSNGMTFVIPDGEYETKSFLKTVEEQEITTCVLAPTMLRWVVDEVEQGSYDISSLRLCMYGSAPATPSLIENVAKTLGCGLIQGYGTSESTAGWISSLTPADHERGLSEKPELLQSVGRPPSYFELSIRDDLGVEVSIGAVGEVWVRSSCIMNGYLNLPEQTAEVLKPGGWLITNDMGLLDEEGYLYLKDRRKFMIVSGGINVFPAHVEAVVSAHPGVSEIAVVGVPHPVWGEAVVAVVCLKSGHADIDQSDLLGFCEGKLSKVMMPKHIHFTTEPLPKSTNLKIQKHLIRKWLLEADDILPSEFF